MTHPLRRPASSVAVALALACAGCGRGGDGERPEPGEGAKRQADASAQREAPATGDMEPRGAAAPEPGARGEPDAGDRDRAGAGEAGDKPNVILIVVDTMRADFTSLVPDRFDATPFLAELARRSVVYSHATAPAQWTVPSMYSLMTGLYPGQHGMEMASVTAGRIISQPVLPEDARTLAERMRDQGYDTFGVCTNQHLAPKFGMSQGFGRFVGDSFEKLPFPEYVVKELAPEMLRAKRYFLWLHYFDPHYPYGAIRPWIREWNDSGLAGYDELAIDFVKRVYRNRKGIAPGSPLPAEAIVPIYRRAMTMHSTSAPILKIFPDYFSRTRPPAEGSPEARYLRFLKAAYASELRASDESIRRVFDVLRLGRDDLVIVTSDHGEELMEHGRLGHRYMSFPSEELVHVPLLIKYPGDRGAGTVVDSAVSLVDIVPTIRGALGLEPLDDLPGEDLAAPGAARPGKRAVFCELRDLNRERKCAVEPPWKLVRDVLTNRQVLFDLERDPQEDVDVSGENPAIVGRMGAALDEWMKTDVPRWQGGQQVPLTPEEVERLRAMGYLK